MNGGERATLRAPARNAASRRRAPCLPAEPKPSGDREDPSAAPSPAIRGRRTPERALPSYAAPAAPPTFSTGRKTPRREKGRRRSASHAATTGPQRRRPSRSPARSPRKTPQSPDPRITRIGAADARPRGLEGPEGDMRGREANASEPSRPCPKIPGNKLAAPPLAQHAAQATFAAGTRPGPEAPAAAQPALGRGASMAPRATCGGERDRSEPPRLRPPSDRFSPPRRPRNARGGRPHRPAPAPLSGRAPAPPLSPAAASRPAPPGRPAAATQAPEAGSSRPARPRPC